MLLWFDVAWWNLLDGSRRVKFGVYEPQLLNLDKSSALKVIKSTHRKTISCYEFGDIQSCYQTVSDSDLRDRVVFNFNRAEVVFAIPTKSPDGDSDTALPRLRTLEQLPVRLLELSESSLSRPPS